MLPTTTEPLGVRFFIDNTSVVAALHNKSTQNEKINKLALESREILQAKQYVASWSWIPSFSNFADVFTRLPQRDTLLENEAPFSSLNLCIGQSSFV
jgi:hypothetical protein